LEVSEEKVVGVHVLRGAPCGATWKAAASVLGMEVEKAKIRIGIETQFHCGGGPGGWNRVSKKNPIHFAAEIHQAAFKKALKLG